MTKYLTAESVCKGHPDKLCDLIADSILDACLRKDKSSRVACEVMATKGRIFVAGEITCSKKINIRWIVRNVLEDVGYNPKKFITFVYVHQQSGDIAGGVDRAIESRDGDTSWYSMLGAGDQGTVYGYATNETSEQLPLPLVYAHSICRKLDSVMKSGVVKNIGPDGKAQVTIEYENGKPKRIKTIVVSVQHTADKDLEVLRSEIISEVLWPVLEDFPFDDATEIFINPSGRFVEGGPSADTGLTGRKIMVDTYGGLAAHGGGAFSGKDPTKVDRSGAYMARAIAKNIVWCDFADKCQVAISYAIGKADPVVAEIDTFGTGKVSEEVILKAVLDVFNLRPAAIIETLGLRDAIYVDTATYGHFSGILARWEWLDKYKELREAVKKYAD
ncbi:MAG: methionine adenosyltransferase [Oscillospiraceae bacterium]